MTRVTVYEANTNHAVDACNVLRRSISEVCGPDYGNDPIVMEGWLSNKTPQNVAVWIDDSDKYSVVANCRSTVAGFAILRGNEILLNYVVAECIGLGAGYMMLKALEDHARHQGLRELCCMSTITARPFYERQGFEPAGEPVLIGGVAVNFSLRKRVAI